MGGRAAGLLAVVGGAAAEGTAVVLDLGPRLELDAGAPVRERGEAALGGERDERDPARPRRRGRRASDASGRERGESVLGGDREPVVPRRTGRRSSSSMSGLRRCAFLRGKWLPARVPSSLDSGKCWLRLGCRGCLCSTAGGSLPLRPDSLSGCRRRCVLRPALTEVALFRPSCRRNNTSSNLLNRSSMGSGFSERPGFGANAGSGCNVATPPAGPCAKAVEPGVATAGEESHPNGFQGKSPAGIPACIIWKATSAARWCAPGAVGGATAFPPAGTAVGWPLGWLPPAE